MTSVAKGLVALMMLPLSGCAAQMAGSAGLTGLSERGVKPLWTGSASGAYVGRNHAGRGGLELSGRHELDHGTTWQIGAQGGYIRNPEPDQTIGGSVYAELGTPLRDGALFPHGSFYVGTTGELLIGLYGKRDVAEVNTAPWLLVQRPELVILGRVRMQRDADGGPDVSYSLDGTLGVGLRLRMISEYF